MIFNCIECGGPMSGHIHTQTHPVVTVKEWCEATDSRYIPLIPAREGQTHAPYYGPGVGFGTTTPFPQAERYVAEVDNVSVVGGHGVVITEDAVLFDPAFGPHSDRFLFNNSALTMQGEDMQVAAYRRDEHLDSGVLLQSWYGGNYHHWLVEHLPKLMLLEQAGIPSEIPLLIDARVFTVPQLLEVFDVVDHQGREVIGLTPDTEYAVDHLVIPSNMFGTGPDLHFGLEVEVGDVTIDREAVEFVRQRVSGTGTGQRRLYIDRRAVSAPIRLRNGAEVQEVFQSLGFEVIHPAEYSFGQQQEMFSNAAVIAGESGAAMTNVLLAPKEAVMICLQALPFSLNIYSDLCAYGGQRSRFLVGDADPYIGGPSYQSSFVYDPVKLREELDSILADV
jgi:capsular polysaccharide biosynthesis protein